MMEQKEYLHICKCLKSSGNLNGFDKWNNWSKKKKKRMNFKKENARSALNLEKLSALTQDEKQLTRYKFC